MGLFSKPKAPKATAEQEAISRRTTSLLDKEIEESEERFKALARGKLGRVSLLSGAPRNPLEAAIGGPRGGSSGVGSLLGRGRGGTGSGSGGGNVADIGRVRRVSIPGAGSK